MNNIFELITTEENKYQTVPHQVTDKWLWRMPEHIETTILYKNSQITTGDKDQKPIKNIVLPILTLQYTAEDFDVKNIELFVDNPDQYYKSFILRKYHDKWARENGIDTFIDEMIESYVDFGGVLVKDVNKAYPEVVKLPTIAFCDQGNLLGGTIGIKHSYSPSQLKEIGTASGWGDPRKGATYTLDEVIALCNETRETPINDNAPNKTTGKNIDVYEVHGTFEDNWLTDTDEYVEEKSYSNQLWVVCFYNDDKEGKKKGIILFRGKEDESPFKLLLRDAIYNRALGRGGAEELFEAQVWTNWNEIIVKEMLEQASKVIYQTADTGFTTRNNVKDAENGSVFVHDDGKPLTQINSVPASINLFNNKINEWEQHAKQLGFANDALLGVSPTSGTPFALQELVTQTGRGPHDRRKGKLAEFVAEIYRDWVIPMMMKDLKKGKKFLTELSLDELQTLSEQVVECVVNRYVKDKLLDGKVVTKEEMEAMKAQYKDDFMKKGSNRFFEIFEKEFDEYSKVDVKINVAGKQYNMQEKVQKLTNIFRQIFSNPQILQNPQMAQLFNEIIETSGLNPINFAGFSKTIPSPMQPTNPMQSNQELPITT